MMSALGCGLLSAPPQHTPLPASPRMCERNYGPTCWNSASRGASSPWVGDTTAASSRRTSVTEGDLCPWGGYWERTCRVLLDSDPLWQHSAWDINMKVTSWTQTLKQHILGMWFAKLLIWQQLYYILRAFLLSIIALSGLFTLKFSFFANVCAD